MYKIHIIICLISVALSKKINFVNKNTPKLSESDLKDSKVCKVLSLTGGGSYGAIEVGILNKILQSSTEVGPYPYDLVSGISAGGLNAGIISTYTKLLDAVDELTSIYSSINTASIYTTDIMDALSLKSLFSTKPLENFIQKTLNTRDLSNLNATFVGSSNLNSGELDVFYLPDYNSNETDVTSLMLMTSAIPFLFPPVEFNGSTYVDGGLISDEIVTGLVSFCPEGVPVQIDIIMATQGNKAFEVDIKNPTSLYGREIDVLFHSFDSQISYIESLCQANSPKLGVLNIYAVDKDIPYNILNFDHGAELIQFAQDNLLLKSYDYC